MEEPHWTRVPLRQQEGLSVYWSGRQKELGYFHQCLGQYAPQDVYPEACLENALSAITRRVFCVGKRDDMSRPPRPEDFRSPREAKQHVRSVTHAFLEAMQKEAQKLEPVTPMTDDEFLSTCRGRQRRCYEQALVSLSETPFKDRDARVNLFVKQEHLKNIPRAIQTRGPRYHVLLGKYIKHKLEHRVMDSLNNIFDESRETKSIAKGLNLDQWAANIHKKWHRFQKPVAISLDVSRFDQHINRHLLKLEHSVISYFSTGFQPGMPGLAELLRLQLLNKGRYRGKDGWVKYVVDGGRMSGDMNTSLGNVLVMCMLLYSYLQPLGIQHEIFDNGDDCVLIVNAHDYGAVIDTIEQWFLELGVTLKIEGLAFNISDIEFCQHKIFYLDGTPKMTPQPGRRIYNDLTTDKPIASPRMWAKWLGAVAGGGNAMSSGVPVFQEFYAWLSRSAHPYTPKEGDRFWRYRDQFAEGMHYGHRPISEATRWSFYEATDLHPDTQVQLELMFAGATPLVHQTPVEKTAQFESLLTALVPCTLVSEYY